MADLQRLKERVLEARENLTKSEAIMGEVKDGLKKEVESLKKLGVEIPDKKEDASDEDYYKGVMTIIDEYVDNLQKEVDKKIDEIKTILEKWDDR